MLDTVDILFLTGCLVVIVLTVKKLIELKAIIAEKEKEDLM